MNDPKNRIYIYIVKHALTMAGWNQSAEHCDRRHHHQADRPDDRNQLVGVAERLPASRRQRMTNGEVAFARDGDQRPGGHRDQGGCEMANTQTDRKTHREMRTEFKSNNKMMMMMVV